LYPVGRVLCKATVEHIFHITRGEDWRAAQAEGSYRVSTRDRTLEQEGFIHCSFAHQVQGVAQAYFGGLEDLVVLEIDRERVKAEVRDESVGRGDQRFPHIYGPLNLDAVISVRPWLSDSDARWIQRLLPRYRYGVIAPGTGGLQRGADYQFYRLVPNDVMQITVGLGVRDYSQENVQSAMAAFWSCAKTLVDEGANSITLSGVPVSAALGRARILELSEEVPSRCGVPFSATLEAMIAALHFLGTPRVVMASRFPTAANTAITEYLAEADIQVVASTERDLSLAQARELTMEQGMQLALDIGREAATLAPDAQAILMPGGATLSLHAIPALEAELGKPVLINMSAEIWHGLVQPGIVPPVEGWGCLVANRATV
jgi:uncharacterized protein (DUF952 family)/maleate cis-trans isomerase